MTQPVQHQKTQNKADQAFLTQVLNLNFPLNYIYHPLYMHNNDNPRIMLITKKLVGTKNYASWKRSIQIALSAKNKLVIVNGSYSKLEPNSPLLLHWNRVIDMCMSWILNTVSSKIWDNMNYVTTTAQM